jgi:GH24 family phage-related lysozyme (muramidase)
MSHAVSARGFKLIKDHEGFLAAPRPLADGGWVVGFGHVRKGKAGRAVTQEEATALLARDLVAFENLVNATVTKRLTQAQFDAIVSFAFSVGEDAFRKSQVVRRLNAGDFVAAACALDAWRKSEVDGESVVVDALVRRRAAEKAFLLRDVKFAVRSSRLWRPQLDHAAAILGAPSVQSTDVTAPEPEFSVGAKLTQILMSEPTTAALLLTDVVVEAPEADNEITTAHAKPVSRAPMRDALPKLDWRGFVQKLPRLDAARSFESLGLFALLAFGAVLSATAASLAASSDGDWAQLVGAAALAAPGVAALLMAGYGLWRAPRDDRKQQA